MYKLKILSITKETMVEDSKPYLKVDVLLASDKVQTKRSFGYPLDTSQDDIKEELKKFVTNFNAEALNQIEQKEVFETEKKADETIKSLIGEEIL